MAERFFRAVLEKVQPSERGAMGTSRPPASREGFILKDVLQACGYDPSEIIAGRPDASGRGFLYLHARPGKFGRNHCLKRSVNAWHVRHAHLPQFPVNVTTRSFHSLEA